MTFDFAVVRRTSLFHLLGIDLVFLSEALVLQRLSACVMFEKIILFLPGQEAKKVKPHKVNLFCITVDLDILSTTG